MTKKKNNPIIERRKKKIKKYFFDFSPREQKVLSLRYGLNNSNAPQSLETVGKEFNYTRERIRQIEGKALIKLELMEK